MPSTNITATEKGWLYAEVADSLAFLPLAQAPFPWICGSEFTCNQQNRQKCFWRLWLWNPETPCKSTTVKVYILKGSQAWINPDQVPRLYLIYQPILLKLKPLDLRRNIFTWIPNCWVTSSLYLRRERGAHWGTPLTVLNPPPPLCLWNKWLCQTSKFWGNLWHDDINPNITLTVKCN